MVLPDSWLTDIFFGGRRQLIFFLLSTRTTVASLFSAIISYVGRVRRCACRCLSARRGPSEITLSRSLSSFGSPNRISVLLSVNIIIIIFPKTQVTIFYSWFQIWSLSARIITSSRAASAHAQTAGHVRSLHISLITSSHLAPHRVNSIGAGEADAGRVQPQLSLH